MGKFMIYKSNCKEGAIYVPVGAPLKKRVKALAKKNRVSMGEFCKQALAHCVRDLEG